MNLVAMFSSSHHQKLSGYTNKEGKEKNKCTRIGSGWWRVGVLGESSKGKKRR